MQSAKIRWQPGPGTAAAMVVKGSGKGFGERKSRKRAAGRAFSVFILSASQCAGLLALSGRCLQQ
jgi:hypothetical protein